MRVSESENVGACVLVTARAHGSMHLLISFRNHTSYFINKNRLADTTPHDTQNSVRRGYAPASLSRMKNRVKFPGREKTFSLHPPTHSSAQ
jgi:hypothetical protein